MLHVNATAYGGGVAELLATHVPLLQDLGIAAEWQVIRGSDEFFTVTKAVHNGLQGADVEWTPHMEHIYLERVLDNALQLEGDWDFVVIHDPQPAAIRDYARGHGFHGGFEIFVCRSDEKPLSQHFMRQQRWELSLKGSMLFVVRTD